MSKYSYKWNMKVSNFTKDKGKVFSCFAGGGGSTMGYKLAGFDVIGCLEIDKRMIAAYQTNTIFGCNSFAKSMKSKNKVSSTCDFCPSLNTFFLPQSFSLFPASEKELQGGEPSKISNSYNSLGKSFRNLNSCIDSQKACLGLVIAENVKGIILGNAKKYIERIYHEFNVAGYYLQHHLLDCSKMGVPQKRERVFFIAVRKDLAKKYLYLVEKDMFTKITYINLHFNQKKILFEEIMNMGPGASNPTLEKIWESCKLGEQSTGFGKDGKGFFSYRKCDPKKVLPTILGGGKSKSVYLMHPYIPRYLNDLEVIQGQSFPLDYDFVGGYVHYVCGMSVPPICMANLADRIYNEWNEIFDRKNNS